ncbi:MAG: hypothetical protein M3044_07305 [Thermoproteota archaeon]|nr:hypothetical protein [Thermoproteota archaeon]
MIKEQLDGERISVRNSGIRITLFSTFTIIGVFVLYGYLVRPENFVFSSKIIQLISDLGITVLVSLVGALFAIGYGIYLICKSERIRIIETIHPDNEVEIRKRSRRSSSIMQDFSLVVNIISQTKYLRLFLLVLVAYAVLFSLISQIIIFRPDVSFSHIYGVTIPSWKITPCCNAPGFVPMFTAYLSDNLIIFIIPVNLVLAVVLSTLVGVNIALAAYMFQNRAKKMDNKSNILYSGGIGGATTGLLTACPICAGTFFSMIVGLVIGASSASAVAGVVTATTTLAPFQMLFIIISIPTLLISPYLTIKSLKK